MLMERTPSRAVPVILGAAAKLFMALCAHQPTPAAAQEGDASKLARQEGYFRRFLSVCVEDEGLRKELAVESDRYIRALSVSTGHTIAELNDLVQAGSDEAQNSDALSDEACARSRAEIVKQARDRETAVDHVLGPTR